MCAESLQSFLLFETLWSPLDFSVHGILQARIPEWSAMAFSRGSALPRDGTQVSYISYIGRQILYY